MKLTRTFHAVGQGAFYSECFQDENGKEIFNVVYDCGTLNSKNYLFKVIDGFAKERKVIDVLFVSHFHEDHVNGISKLLSQCEARKIIIPYIQLATFIEQYIFNIIDTGTVANMANEFIANYYLEENDRIIKIPPFEFGGGDERVEFSYSYIAKIQSKVVQKFGDFWEYIPFNIIDDRANVFVQCFMNDYPVLYDAFAKMNKNGIRIINDYFTTKDKITEMTTYYRRFFHKLNESSMTVVSKPISESYRDEMSCLYTGDFPFNVPRFHNQLRNYYNHQWDSIGTMQIAHHGASKDNPKSLFDRKRDYVVCYGVGNRYRHPGMKTIDNIVNSESQPIEVTQFCEYYRIFNF